MVRARIWAAGQTRVLATSDNAVAAFSAQNSWEVAVTARWPKCPDCKVLMGVKRIVTAGPRQHGGKVIYACMICKIETERRYKQLSRRSRVPRLPQPKKSTPV